MASKAKLMQDYRTDGMEYALRIVREKGVEELAREVKLRRGTGISLRMTQEEVDEAALEIKQRCLQTMTAVSILTLHDEFEFGRKRIDRFLKRFRTKAEVLLEHYATWDDYAQIIKDELGYDIPRWWV